VWEPNEALEDDQLAELLDEVAQAAAPKLTLAQREQILTNAIEQKDIDLLFALQAKMTGLIQSIAANGKLQAADLTPDKLVEVFDEYANLRELETVYKVRYQMIRSLIFAAVTDKLAGNNVADPEHAPGELPVPARGMKFARRGGRRKVTLDKTALREKLGPERWERVCKAVIVPAVPEHEVEEFDQDALFDLVAEDASVMELIRACAVVGGYTPSSLHTEKLKK
jgi:hypothetical protein